jgi:mRNA interferase RelE/StbE
MCIMKGLSHPKTRLSLSEENLNNIPNLKKPIGHKSAYRVRLGDYRVGFFYENHKIIFARIIHRKDIYKSFP